LEKLFRINNLYDFYGRLLTDHQKRFVELYYGQDLSLGEIAENYNVSRQAVYDTLKRAEQLLFGYEDKLGLVAKFDTEKSKLAAAVNLLDEYMAAPDGAKLIEARKLLSDILDMSG